MIDILNEQMEKAPNGLQLLVLGPSGSGKSHLGGTYPGKTLYLYGDSERHGVKSAFKEGGDNLIPVAWGSDKSGDRRSPDKAYKYIQELLNIDSLKAAGIQFIVMDSLVDLMKVIRHTAMWTNRCATAKGGHNSFAEPDAYVEMIDPILSTLRHLQEFHGIDFMVTGDLEIQEQEENGMIIQTKPRLPSFSVAERVIQQFQDIIMISRVKGKKKTGPVIQMGASATRNSVDEHGRLVKTIDFTPRLADVLEPPPMIKADLKELLLLKGITK